MIERLDSKMDCVEITVLGKHTECLGFDSAKEIGKKLNELVDAVNVLQESMDLVQSTLVEEPDTHAENVPAPITLIDIFNEMGRLYADLWNKMEDIHRDLKNKGRNNE
jgi:hypothetical protein